MVVRVALLQVEVSDEEPVAARVDRVLAMTAEAAAGHDVVVLPELWPIGAFAVDRMVEHAVALDGPLVTALARVAAEAGVWLFAGSLPERSVGPEGSVRHFNTQVVLDSRGALAARYRKVHLFGFNGGETTVMSSGTDVVVLDTPLGPTGLVTCYDLRFPELFRRLVDGGAEAFVLPSGWPERRRAHWKVLARARAVENQAHVLACNTAGTHAGVPMAGHSMAVDPQGKVLAEAGAGEQVLSVVIDPDRVTAWRGAFPALADRRLS